MAADVTRLKARKNAPGVFDVEGRHGAWLTIVRGDSKACTCPDFLYRRFDGTTCKHIDAAVILLEAERKAFDVANTPKSRSAEVPVVVEPAEVDLHYRGKELFYGDHPVRTWEDVDKLKKEVGKTTK